MRCEYCKKKTPLPTECKYCGKQLCLKCLLPTKHECERIDMWRSKDDLTDRLMNSKCVGKKIDKI